MYLFIKQSVLKLSLIIALILGFAGAIQYITNSTSAQSLQNANKADELMATPIINEVQEITPSTGTAGLNIGFSSAIDGDTAVIGTIQENGGKGAVYVFVRNGNTWTEQAKLTASDAAANDHFGHSVAIQGDTIAVGAPLDGSNAGSAYVFVRNGTTWTEQQKLTQGNTISALTGSSVAIWGDTVMVGGPNLGSGPFGTAGVVYFYTRTGTTWGLQQQVNASDFSTGDHFGASVGIEGNTAVVGARGGTGAIYVFTRIGTVWTERIKFLANDAATGKNFATSLSYSGNTIAVGAYSDDEMSIASGSVYIFTGSGASWSQQTKLVASDRAADDQFGFSVSLKGDSLAVGARLADSSTTNSGAGYVFKRTGTTWTEEQKLLASMKNASGLDSMGYSIGHSGRYIISGAISRDVAAFSRYSKSPKQNIAGTGQGSGYIFDLLPGSSCNRIDPGDVGWWYGDLVGRDLRSRNHGTLQNGTTYGTGKVGQGFSFDGVDDYVSIPDTPENSVSSAITIEGWINPTVAPTTFGTIFSKYTSPTNNFGYSLALASNQTVQFAVYGNGTGTIQYVVNSNPTVPLNQFTHIAGTFDTATQTMKLYFDGAEVLTTTVASDNVNPIFDSASEVRIGAIDIVGGGSTDQHFQGIIDEINLFNRALTLTEIQGVFDAGIRGRCKPTATVKPSGIVGWWAGEGGPIDINNVENGTLQNGAGFAVGKVGQSFKLDGIDDYVSIPDSPANSVSTAITIEGWINPSAAPLVLGSILTKYNTPTGNLSYALSLKPDQTLQFAVYGNGSGTIVYGAFSTPTIPLNQYTHVAGTFDASTQTMKLFLNGVEVSQTLTSTDNVNPIFDGTSEVRIGSLDSFASGSVNQLFEGEIDEVSLYNTVLTATEIKSVFDAGIAGTLKTADTNPAPPLSELKMRKGKTPFGTAVVTTVGDATLTFSNVTTAGKTQQIPLDPNGLPVLTNGTHTGLLYDISTSAVYTGNIDVCFNLPAFTSSVDFTQLRVLHLENGIWENRTTTSVFGTRTLCSNVSSLSPFAIAQFAPTAAEVSISGRVLTQNGRGVPRTTVQIMDQSGNVRTALTNHFGYYKFTNLEVGQTLIFNVYNKQYQFQTRVVNINENISSLNFVAEN